MWGPRSLDLAGRDFSVALEKTKLSLRAAELQLQEESAGRCPDQTGKFVSCGGGGGSKLRWLLSKTLHGKSS